MLPFLPANGLCACFGLARKTKRRTEGHLNEGSPGTDAEIDQNRAPIAGRGGAQSCISVTRSGASMVSRHTRELMIHEAGRSDCEIGLDASGDVGVGRPQYYLPAIRHESCTEVAERSLIWSVSFAADAKLPESKGAASEEDGIMTIISGCATALRLPLLEFLPLLVARAVSPALVPNSGF
ncbi:hypothetical protein B0H19DRAFT_1239207 [Mycena capillaripes]|nr:hypothetical protein B0H19DRAFT_1239207 [Mycena capillaripes]